MVETVNEAFSKFLADEVNLDPAKTGVARGSRDWLVERVHEFPAKDGTFPSLYPEKDIFFGSFERRTKKRPLDDIDIMICLAASGGTYIEAGSTVFIHIPESATNLKRLCHDDGGGMLNSRKVINKFVAMVNDVPQYEKAETSRNGEAATLKLLSHDWNFDIVPCFFTSPNEAGRDFYLIPNGEGHWKKTDPRIDRARVTRVNQLRSGLVLNIIRLIKFWNGRPTMPSIPSYVLENMVLDLYEQRDPCTFVDLEFPFVMGHLSNKVYGEVLDPKGLQGDLNGLSIFDRLRISMRCDMDKARAEEARSFESSGDHRRAINKWAEIFGERFPAYG